MDWVNSKEPNETCLKACHKKNEIRKPVEGYEDRYEISNFGRLYSKKTKRFLTGKINSSGYLQFTLTVGKIEKNFYAHRLVAKHFILNDKLLKEVNHIDGNKLNNVHTNLEWVSRTKNYRHAVSSGLIIRDEKGKFLRQL